MTTKELIERLKTFPPESEVSVTYWNGMPTTVMVEDVIDNAGPSLYAEGWDGSLETDPSGNLTLN